MYDSDMRYGLFLLAFLLVTPVHAQPADSLDWGGRAGLLLGAVETEGYARGGYGLDGGVAVRPGRFRLRGEVSLLITQDPSDEARRELGLCPDEPLSSNEPCTQLLAWVTTEGLFDVYDGKDVTVALGGGGDLGSHVGFHAVGAVFFDRWGVQLKGSPRQAALSVFLHR